MSLSSRGTHNRPEITTLFGPPQIPGGTGPTDPADNPFAITRKSLGKTLLVLAAFPFLWGLYVGAYHYWHPVPTLWTRADATVLDGKIEVTRNACSAGVHSRGMGHSATWCDYYIFRFGVSYLVGGAARQSKIDSPLFEHKREAEIWASQFASGRQLAIIYDPLQADRVRRADDPPPTQYAGGPYIGYYPTGLAGPMIAEDSAAGPLKAALCFFLPGIVLLLSSRSKRELKSI